MYNQWESQTFPPTFPSTWEELEIDKSGLLDQLEEKVSKEPLSPSDLNDLNQEIEYCQSPRSARGKKSFIEKGIGILRKHFGIAYSVSPQEDPVKQIELIQNIIAPDVTATLAYFTHDNPEAKSFNIIFGFFYDQQKR